jgi:hypothetical protein
VANPRLLKALSGGPVFVERAVPGIAYGKLAAILLLPIIKKKFKKKFTDIFYCDFFLSYHGNCNIFNV